MKLKPLNIILTMLMVLILEVTAYSFAMKDFHKAAILLHSASLMLERDAERSLNPETMETDDAQIQGQ